MLYNTVVVHYAEIGTKGKNRAMFENQLIRNIQSKLKDEKVSKAYGRILVNLDSKSNIQAITKKLERVFGISWFAPTVLTKHTNYLKAAQKLFDEAVKQSRKERPTFRIDTHRSYKEFPMSSMEFNKHIADKVNAKLELPVNLSQPDFTLWASVIEKGILFHIAGNSENFRNSANKVRVIEKNSGLGGMPVGVSGRVLMLLSGGIDSPVAAYQLMKRGCRVDFVHFHGEAPDKIKELKKILDKYQYKSKIWNIPFKPLQMEIIKKVPQKQRLLIYRRFMFRIAEQIAQKHGHLALATGESIAQVASQTIENIAAVDSVVNLPVFRPLITWDKQEIVNLAQKIGTYKISIQPYEDCCSFFVPKHPELRATAEQLDKLEKKLKVNELIKKAIVKHRNI